MEGLSNKDKITDLREEEIERLLKQLNNPAVKSFHLPNGDIIDCVRITDLVPKGHKIQMRPTIDPTSTVAQAQLPGKAISLLYRPHLTAKMPGIQSPIIRTTREDIIRRANCLKKTGPPSLGMNIMNP